ncbi:MAG: threonine synthase [Saprospiraceae bacterium]|mgnify:FL=1|jgi:threonine synthase|uniref:threonine synthase n=1 Tax=Candidatus Brachybacter algidus TaxID=2982024 RepID=UPI001B55EA89|nr:threonine synthase [Candidatus Brachybacter algidus]MBP7304488.1 threonine synthase [Saprospiraceae bacterium]MBK6372433.1 threonine synthase [Candidatus Brachybacter algidus]MBK6450260.1 threonine synthase [Candidatus Brachybacter algidus]MBK7603159.1 threonine synthase [Candidatus Brachybacter algidus]MBK8602788.1 threonine synthase [Candidatus Brachybacter algidus]
MKYISTRSSDVQYDFDEIVRKGIPDDGGLFVPENIIKFDEAYFINIQDKTFHEIAFDVSRTFIGTDIIPDEDLKIIIETAFNFDLPLVKVQKDLSVLELFHGPTSAFKDFGARFMANVLGFLQKKNDIKTTIVTATSGDTGGAVASAFHNVKDVNVFILYPKGRVSDFQEKQIAGLGDNIRAIEINGSFDDCQAMVKACFEDNKFKEDFNLTSSNSVNFSRIIPQIIYYFEAYRNAIAQGHKNVSFIVPSGNFGNITGAVYAKKMGLPMGKLIAATNANDAFPNYLQSGIYETNKSKRTISNAMDVGNPSNLERIFYIFRSTWNKIVQEFNSHSIDDQTTKTIIENYYNKYNYIVDPHTAVGIANYLLETMYHSDTHYIVLATAHPYKFESVMHSVLPKLNIPTNTHINNYLNITIDKVSMTKDLEALKSYINKEVNN